MNEPPHEAGRHAPQSNKQRNGKRNKHDRRPELRSASHPALHVRVNVVAGSIAQPDGIAGARFGGVRKRAGNSVHNGKHRSQQKSDKNGRRGAQYLRSNLPSCSKRSSVMATFLQQQFDPAKTRYTDHCERQNDDQKDDNLAERLH